ncbi:MAG TPA: nitroreductase family deazaflavin-dependent oxidoreductase [Pseudonocardiaceae bacterium]|nr:nitroreductase family deazaflavin-dependent oxidoreductase [Pseudonocardiaceae bacterium]
MSDFNSQVIDKYRANEGKLGDPFPFPVLLLHTVGARSGEPRINPVAYLPDGERLLVFASYGGADKSPAWYYNLIAKPTATVEVGTETFDVTVSELKGEERDRFYKIQADQYENFAEYERKTSRVIPVVALTRV